MSAIDYIFCPGFVARAKDISLPSRFLYQILVSLSQREGYCWPTDQYLADCLGYENVGSVKNLLSTLEKSGYISRVRNKKRREIYPRLLKERLGKKSIKTAVSSCMEKVDKIVSGFTKWRDQQTKKLS